VADSGDPQADVIWMRPQRPRRSPQVALSRDQITATALALADSEGVDAVTMRQVAARLGCGTMSLYRHVRTKDELFDLMADAAMGEEDRPAHPSGDWREDLGRLAHAKRAVMLRHPWLASLLAGRPVLGPNVLASTELALSAVSELGLSMDEMVRVINTLHAFVNGFVQTELEERAWRHPAGTGAEGGAEGPWQDRMLPYLQHLMDSGQYPFFTRMVNEAEPHPDTDESFAWQLRRVLDGLSAGLPG